MNVNDSKDATSLPNVPQGEFSPRGASTMDAGTAAIEHGRAGIADASAASDANRPAAAPDISITGASSSQEAIKGKGGGGLDRLEVHCLGKWDTEKFAELAKLLGEAKATSQRCNSAGAIEHPDGGQVLVRPMGFRVGLVPVEWALDFDGFTVGIPPYSVADGEQPNVFVTAGSMVLMQLGHQEAWEQAVRFLSGLGFSIKEAVPSRFDACVDLVGHDMAEYAERYLNDAYICKAKKDNYYRENKRITGLVFGRKILCRIYDKLLEAARDPLKAAVLVAHRYGGENPERAVRVEFQIRREVMREQWTVADVEDLFRKLPAILTELTRDWLRFTEHPVDRDGKHQGRSETWSRWLEVQAMFQGAFSPNGVEAPRYEPKQPEICNLLRQAFGCIKSAAALVGFCPKDAGELFVWLEKQLHGVMPRDWWLSLQRRSEVLRARKPVNRKTGDVWSMIQALSASQTPSAEPGSGNG